MNRIIKYLALVIMVLMVLPNNADASCGRLRTPQARARALQLSQLIAQRARQPIYRVVQFAKRCKSGICCRNR